jgi:hypothetical protein
MSIQYIINNAESISFNRRKQVGIQYSRNEIAYSTLGVSRNPWRLTVKISKPIEYSTARAIVSDLDKLDRVVSETINFKNNTNLTYITQYQGALAANQLSQLRVLSASGSNLTLTNLPTGIDPNTVLFEKGDFLQINGYANPFTVTARVVRGTSAVIVPLHRSVFINPTLIASQPLTVGYDVSFKVRCSAMPTYTLTRGGTSGLITFDGDFELYEDVDL